MGDSASDAFGFLVAALLRDRFSFFDIVKLPPASVLDRGRQNGFTVMLDDIFAAVYASWLLIRWPGWQGSTEPLHLCGFCDE